MSEPRPFIALEAGWLDWVQSMETEEFRSGFANSVSKLMAPYTDVDIRKWASLSERNWKSIAEAEKLHAAFRLTWLGNVGAVTCCTSTISDYSGAPDRLGPCIMFAWSHFLDHRFHAEIADALQKVGLPPGPGASFLSKFPTSATITGERSTLVQSLGLDPDFHGLGFLDALQIASKPRLGSALLQALRADPCDPDGLMIALAWLAVNAPELAVKVRALSQWSLLLPTTPARSIALAQILMSDRFGAKPPAYNPLDPHSRRNLVMAYVGQSAVLAGGKWPKGFRLILGRLHPRIYYSARAGISLIKRLKDAAQSR